MKRIGILTLNDYFNYGNRLQNYALQRFLLNLTSVENVETIWYRKNNMRINRKYITFDNIRRYIFNRHNYREYIDKHILFNDIIRENIIKRFSDKYIYSVFLQCKN